MIKSILPMPELDILKVSLARIKMDRKCEAQFDEGEFESILGVSTIEKDDLQWYIDRLILGVRLETPPDGSYHIIAPIDSIAVQRMPSGLWKGSVSCTSKAYELLSTREGYNWLRRRMSLLIRKKSRPSQILLNFLEERRNAGLLDVEINYRRLRALLGYSNRRWRFGKFNELVLKGCQRELGLKTDCRFTYETVDSGQDLQVRFHIEPPAI